MTLEHWFDDLSKATSRAITRREITGSIVVLLPSLLFRGETAIATDKKKRGKKQDSKKGKKDKGKKEKGQKGNGNQGSPNQGNGAERPDLMGPPEPVVDDCVDLSPDWPDSPELVSEWQSACREQREQCPDDFCLYIHNWDAPDDSPAVMCCASPKTCCHDGCFDTQNDNTHCGDCRTTCGPDEVCRAGDCVCEGPNCPQICWNFYCSPGLECVDGVGNPCNGQTSIDCQCGCAPGYHHCLHPQIGWACQSNPC